MQLSPSAQELRDLSNRIARITEYNTQDDTNEPDVDITPTDLSRLKIALRPLVSDDLQSRFMQVLNKMVSGQPVTFSESKLLTSAFISMADIISGDNSLISRLRKDIRDYNDQHDADSEEDIAADVSPDMSFDASADEELPKDNRELK
jgi:hypothetical protein